MEELERLVNKIRMEERRKIGVEQQTDVNTTVEKHLEIVKGRLLKNITKAITDSFDLSRGTTEGPTKKLRSRGNSNLLREKIVGCLNEATTPLTINSISSRTGISNIRATEYLCRTLVTSGKISRVLAKDFPTPLDGTSKHLLYAYKSNAKEYPDKITLTHNPKDLGIRVVE